MSLTKLITEHINTIFPNPQTVTNNGPNINKLKLMRKNSRISSPEK